MELTPEEPTPIQFPENPPPGLLMAMAMKLDRALGCPGYYDEPFMMRLQTARGLPAASHAQRLEAALWLADNLYDEVSGHGFYAPERAEWYESIMRAGLQPENENDEPRPGNDQGP